MHHPSPPVNSLDRLAIAQSEAAGISISELWNHYQSTKGSTPKPLSDAALELVEAKKSAGRAKGYVHQLEWLVFRFAAHCGPSLKVSDVTIAEVSSFLAKSSVSTRQTEVARLRTFLRFCMRQGYCREVVTDRLEVTRREDLEPVILSNQQLDDLLQAIKAKDFDLLEYVWLAGALGIRRAEIMRLRPNNLHASEGFVEIGAGIAKNRSRRLVKVFGALPKKSEELLHLKWRSNFRKRFGATQRAAGICKWPRNVLRHSAATHLAHYLSEEQKIADHLGNSPQMIHRHYRGLATSEQSAGYWRVWAKHLAA